MVEFKVLELHGGSYKLKITDYVSDRVKQRRIEVQLAIKTSAFCNK